MYVFLDSKIGADQKRSHARLNQVKKLNDSST
jgi:hypothetical protein